MKTILSLPLSQIHNGEHYEFENTILDVFTPAVAAGANLTEQHTQLRESHDEETEVYRTNQAYKQTKALVQLDTSRDKKFNFIKNVVGYYLETGDGARKAAAEEIDFILNPYRQGPVRGYQDNTAELGKFVVDMAAAPYPTHIATLGLTEALAGLKADNDAFHAEYEVRAEEGLDRAGHEKIDNLRRKFDKAWHVVATVLPSLHLTEKDPTKKATLGKVIDEINAHILQTKKMLAARGIGSASVGVVDVDRKPGKPDTQPAEPPSWGSGIDPDA
jgi:hypothetical protein